MIIGTPLGGAMRAIGGVDYENARIIAGRALRSEDARAHVAIVGRFYARQRLNIAEPGTAALAGQQIVLGGQPFQVVGVYTTANDFGDNHVGVPIEAFRDAFRPGKKLTKTFVTVDSVGTVERAMQDLKDTTRFPEVDTVTTPEAVSTARTTLGSLAVASVYGSILLFAIGAVLVGFVMVLSTRERVREIGTLKTIGASNGEVVIQFLTEAVALSGLGGLGAVLVAAIFAQVLQRALGLPVAFDGRILWFIGVGSVVFAALGSFCPVIHGVRLSPVEAMRSGLRRSGP